MATTPPTKKAAAQAKSEPKAKPADDAGVAEVQAVFDAETRQGFRGVEVDPTPNENYTLKGVLAGKPTPETDADAAAKAADATRPVSGL